MFSDALYAAAGAEIVSAEEAWKQQVLYTCVSVSVPHMGVDQRCVSLATNIQ
jgi:NAD/NADP transhydrogenase alpha subunit